MLIITAATWHLLSWSLIPTPQARFAASAHFAALESHFEGLPPQLVSRVGKLIRFWETFLSLGPDLGLQPCRLGEAGPSLLFFHSPFRYPVRQSLVPSWGRVVLVQSGGLRNQARIGGLDLPYPCQISLAASPISASCCPNSLCLLDSPHQGIQFFNLPWAPPSPYAYVAPSLTQINR